MARHVRDERRSEHGARSARVEDGAMARDRFGGFDLPATLAGLFSAIGVMIVLGGIFAAAGNFGYMQTEGDGEGIVNGGLEGVTEGVALGGLVAGFVTLLVAFLVGGWVAGRVSRYDGGLNGLFSAVWFVVLAAVFGGLGAWAEAEWDVFAEVELPGWFNFDDYTVAAAVSAVIGVALVLLAGWFGGKLGERYHRRADAEVIRTRGAVETEREVIDTRDTRDIRDTDDDTMVSGRGDTDVDDARRVEERRR
jgi:hypothetical protein